MFVMKRLFPDDSTERHNDSANYADHAQCRFVDTIGGLLAASIFAAIAFIGCVLAR